MSEPIAAASRPVLARARRRLIEWYDGHRRDLPWRRTRDPYAIWISETMLQQTRVETVIPYYERFLERFPDLESLASADLERVYEVWTGLGYYSRARNLHDAAGVVVDEHRGRLPSEASALRELKGIGRYTAGALASIAFDRQEPIVDGNVVRVLARLLGVREDVGDRSVIEHFWSLAGELVRGQRPGDLNQAIMELGATLCTPRSPGCGQCPLRRDCVALREGDAEALPRKTRKPAARRVEAVAAWLRRGDKVLAVRRPEGGLLGGLWELAGGELAGGEAPEESLRRSLADRLGLTVAKIEAVGSVEHLFTHRRLKLHVFRCDDPVGRVRRQGWVEHRWLAPHKIATLPHGGPTRKALALLGEASDEPHRVRMRRAAHAPG